jgi:hypothetical protein
MRIDTIEKCIKQLEILLGEEYQCMSAGSSGVGRNIEAINYAIAYLKRDEIVMGDK